MRVVSIPPSVRNRLSASCGRSCRYFAIIGGRFRGWLRVRRSLEIESRQRLSDSTDNASPCLTASNAHGHNKFLDVRTWPVVLCGHARGRLRERTTNSSLLSLAGARPSPSLWAGFLAIHPKSSWLAAFAEATCLSLRRRLADCGNPRRTLDGSP